ncbi:cyclic nucleotide-binding domain-containing protein [Rhodoplanes sp. TEM]|uniref:Cyclic nucleotide-binding domain-containing protein n=1 Tax=Rhodoplanes tepidamans TaxID=200616 RepID=A0ABT5JD78_RHOTP|nr:MULTISPECIES: cyclic nucleotide-binding domain-containing protein [Rhodoplanes]MDC7787636.1 cyclic nucleotide-binding domain-containing protein [Rhodoplanes tepidamans]MDC7984548.1 cyclic nucleotide-binding domain-containing protein [Rhodoplanes sp. TEM]MDQ0355205.1 CRP-like cAMP-binding protein [Rhodoplanes tepidamans]
MPPGGFNFSVLARPEVPERTLRAGEVIFREGEPAAEMFLIKSGTVAIRSDDHLIAELGDNEVFGEMALIDRSPRSATALAVTDVTLIPVSEKQFLFLVAETPFFALTIMRVLVHRLRLLNRVG